MYHVRKTHVALTRGAKWKYGDLSSAPGFRPISVFFRRETVSREHSYIPDISKPRSAYRSALGSCQCTSLASPRLAAPQATPTCTTPPPTSTWFHIITWLGRTAAAQQRAIKIAPTHVGAWLGRTRVARRNARRRRTGFV